MLKPSMNELMAKVSNRYLLVNLTAQRARDISEESEKTHEKLPDKPVKLALDEIAAGQVVYRDGPRPEPEPQPEPQLEPAAAPVPEVIDLDGAAGEPEEKDGGDSADFALEPDIIYSGRADFSDSSDSQEF